MQARALAESVSSALSAGTSSELGGLESVELVMSSPLTRALQTCVVGLGPLLRARGLRCHLVPSCRESVNPGSADSFGCAVGEREISTRLHAKTAELYGSEEQEAAHHHPRPQTPILDPLPQTIDPKPQPQPHRRPPTPDFRPPNPTRRHEQATALLDGIQLDDLEVRDRWWSNRPESKVEVVHRLTELISQIR